MLNKEETTRLQLCYDAVVVGIGVLSPETIEWLVIKLKEINDEALHFYEAWKSLNEHITQNTNEG